MADAAESQEQFAIWPVGCISVPSVVGVGVEVLKQNLPGKKLLFFVTEDWYFCSHRLDLAVAAKAAGYEVVVVTHVTDHGNQITDAGLRLIPFKLSRRSLNPVKELGVIFRLVSLYRSERPQLVHHVALKPVVYGSLVARLTGVSHIINAVAGLGFMFSSLSFKARLLKGLVTKALRLLFMGQGVRVILQNPHDRDLLCSNKIVEFDKTVLIRGSGVDTSTFNYIPEPAGDPVVVLASRLLWEKGVGEFVEAARSLHALGVKARFVIAGDGDSENPSSIGRAQLQAWVDDGSIEWWGKKTDMPAVYATSHIVCLPSYYGEGVPKALIEAASCGRPVVTTDTAGCRDIVRDGENGYLVPVRDSAAIAQALGRLIESKALREEMGLAGRNIVEQDFSLEQVIDETLGLYSDCLQER